MPGEVVRMSPVGVMGVPKHTRVNEFLDPTELVQKGVERHVMYKKSAMERYIVCSFHNLPESVERSSKRRYRFVLGV
jgi:hypothetical protein